VILTALKIDRKEFESRTGWEIKPEGACKAHVCVPLPDGANDQLDARMLSERLGMPLVEDADHELWCLGPESGGHALSSAQFPDLVLPDWHGGDFDLRSLRGQKIFLLAWASW